MQLAYFATACDKHSIELADFLYELLDELNDGEDVGVEPYQVPRRLIDPKFRRRIFLSFDFFFDWVFLGLETCCSTLSSRTTPQIFTHLSTKNRETILRPRQCGRQDLLRRRFPTFPMLCK